MSKVSDIKTEAEYAAWAEEEAHKDYRERVCRKLRLELGVRKDNDHVGSGLGGNASQFVFFLSHSVCTEKSPDDQVRFLDDGPGEILIQIPQKCEMKAVRQALNSFYETHPERNNFTDEQIMNPSFLRDVFPPTNLNITFLIKALEIGYDFVSWLDSKGELMAEIEKMRAKEVTLLQANCIKDMGFPSEMIELLKEKGNKSSKLRSLCSKHPVWGARITAVGKRYAQIWDNLLSQEDWDKFNTMGAFPDYIIMFSVRNCVQIDRLVKYNLDEKAEFLAHVNKTIAEPLNSEK